MSDQSTTMKLFGVYKLEAAWQDKGAARPWNVAAAALESAAARILNVARVTK